VKLLRNLLDKQEKHFLKGGKLEKLFPLYEAVDTFLYTPASPTKAASHIRDVMDLKRMMMTVVIALLPAVLMAFYNTGLQANLGLQKMGGVSSAHWQAQVIEWLGVGFDPSNILGNMLFGALYFLPVYLVTIAVGGFWEVIFATVRKHEINEGFLVTSLLFPLILPPNIPYWQVAIGISFIWWCRDEYS
jgi:Na+-transporting NADH:ubiquinone oxidoreductase subunit B